MVDEGPEQRLVREIRGLRGRLSGSSPCRKWLAAALTIETYPSIT